MLPTSSDSQQRLSHFSHFVGARPSHEHLRQPLCDVRFIAAVPLKRLRVELTCTISGHFDLLEPTRRRYEVAGVGAIAIPFAAAG